MNFLRTYFYGCAALVVMGMIVLSSCTGDSAPKEDIGNTNPDRPNLLEGYPLNQEISELDREETQTLCKNIINMRIGFENTPRFRVLQCDFIALFRLINREDGNEEICEQYADDCFDSIEEAQSLVQECPMSIQNMFSGCSGTLNQVQTCLGDTQNQILSLYNLYSCDNYEESLMRIRESIDMPEEEMVLPSCQEIGTECEWVIEAYQG